MADKLSADGGKLTAKNPSNKVTLQAEKETSNLIDGTNRKVKSGVKFEVTLNIGNDEKDFTKKTDIRSVSVDKKTITFNIDLSGFEWPNSVGGFSLTEASEPAEPPPTSGDLTISLTKNGVGPSATTNVNLN
jgi:hypothetical protein